MTLEQEGKRRRYFHEREEVQASQSLPIHFDISPSARKRLGREVESLLQEGGFDRTENRFYSIKAKYEKELQRVLGDQNSQLALDSRFLEMSLSQLLSCLEIAVDLLWFHRRSPATIERLQSILADDKSGYRFREVGPRSTRLHNIQKIDNVHLNREITKKVFLLTREQDFASAEQDYSAAWTHLSQGRYDDALVNASKALESACKIAIFKQDSTQQVNNKKLGQLIPLLAELDLIPSKIQTMVSQLKAIYEHSGSLRNVDGTAHGSLEVLGPEASVALLGLRLTGTLIVFLCERCSQIHSTSTQ